MGVDARRVAAVVAVAVCITSCCKKGAPSTPAPPPEPQKPLVLGPAPPLPFAPDLPFDALPRRAGTGGEFEFYAAPMPVAPVHGALVPWPDGTTAYRLHQPISIAAPGSGDWTLVLAESGVWLLETETLAVRGRVAPLAEGDLAASHDGKRFAYGRCADRQCYVDIRSFPGGALERSVPVDPPHRLRFSADDTRLAVASTKNNSVTLIELANGTPLRLDSGNDVNDAVILPVGPSWIACGTDSDSFSILDWSQNSVVFDSRARMRAELGRGFDQNALAYDASRDELLVGGNDDVVWRFGDVRSGTPVLVNRGGFANDVEDILLLPSGDAAVGLDCGSISILHASGATSPGIGRDEALSSWGARLAPGPKGDVLAVLGGTVVRWTPGQSRVVQCPFFGWLDSWQKHYGARDVLLWRNGPGAAFAYELQRAPLQSTTPLEVASHYVGLTVFESHSPDVIAFADGTRVMIGAGTNNALRVYRLPEGGALSEPQDSPGVQYAFIHNLVKADGARFAYVGGRQVAEIDAQGVKPVGELGANEDLRWNSKAGAWEACRSRACRTVGPS